MYFYIFVIIESGKTLYLYLFAQSGSAGLANLSRRKLLCTTWIDFEKVIVHILPTTSYISKIYIRILILHKIANIPNF